MIQPVFRCPSLLAALAVFGIALHASAQVNYLRELSGTQGFSPVLPMTQAPYDISRPPFTVVPKPYLATVTHYYPINPSSGALSPAIQFPGSVKLRTESLVAFAGRDPDPQKQLDLVYLVSTRRFLVTFNLTGEIKAQTEPLDLGVFSSMAARSRDAELLSLIADNQHYTVNPTTSTGTLTPAPLLGVDMNAAFYQSYGQDGLLYVLDYANKRIASFNPDNAFAPVAEKSFSLHTGVTTANVQFAIGVTGSFYLADGLGGGSYYDSNGNYKGVFTLPDDPIGAVPYGETYGGASYVSTDAGGSVYVFDRGTGFHQFQDVAAVPEPSTALAGVALIGLAGASRRRRSGRVVTPLQG